MFIEIKIIQLNRVKIYQIILVFGVGNGVRQGGIFFVVYIDKLLAILCESGFGCRNYWDYHL